eukprot:GHVO01041988.1.p1 GENE.GHVO01041988.1~~GHVO01041988.1.p1  ORF type:complete len:104 (-),score=7.14 GHVO01041988.1:365-676(-)
MTEWIMKIMTLSSVPMFKMSSLISDQKVGCDSESESYPNVRVNVSQTVSEADRPKLAGESMTNGILCPSWGVCELIVQPQVNKCETMSWWVGMGEDCVVDEIS